MTRTATILALALCATSASAEGWSVTDFSSVPDRGTCMSYADSTITTYRQRFGGDGFTGRSDWTVGGYDLRGEVVDALFICPDEAGMVAPFLIVYNSDSDNDAREMIADRLGDIWDEIVAGGGSASGGVMAPAGGATK